MAALRILVVLRLLRIGAALQGWTIVVGIGVGILLLRTLLLLFGAGAEARLAGLIVLHLAREHDVAQAALHAVELGGSDDIFRFVRQNARDFFLRGFDAIGRRRVR